MPEGDTIFRAARTLHRALAGQSITGFESVFPKLNRVNDDLPLTGQIVERVESHGKHLLMWFSSGLVLRTHMRMHGSWHIYRPGERWQRPRHEMRILLHTPAIDAVAFSVPVAELVTQDQLARSEVVSELGPDLLSEPFDPAVAVARIEARGDMEIADALLDQRALAGIGNVYKSEVLFAGRVSPFARVDTVGRERLERLVALAVKLMRANVSDGASGGIVTYGGMRRTTGRADPSARLWVYRRFGQPCRRCGTPVSRRKQGPFARSTYWCEKCQPTPRGSDPAA